MRIVVGEPERENTGKQSARAHSDYDKRHGGRAADGPEVREAAADPLGYALIAKAHLLRRRLVRHREGMILKTRILAQTKPRGLVSQVRV